MSMEASKLHGSSFLDPSNVTSRRKNREELADQASKVGGKVVEVAVEIALKSVQNPTAQVVAPLVGKVSGGVAESGSNAVSKSAIIPGIEAVEEACAEVNSKLC